MRILTASLALALHGTAATLAFEPPLVPLDDKQLDALEAYAAEKTEKAFAAGPGGAFGSAAGFASAAIAVREALKACDGGGDEPSQCVVIDINGAAVSIALQLAQASRANGALLDEPLALRDLALDTDAWRALESLNGKKPHTAFAMSLKGSWARAWEASTLAEAERQALDACNAKDKAKTAPCFILASDGARRDGATLLARPDQSVASETRQQD